METHARSGQGDDDDEMLAEWRTARKPRIQPEPEVRSKKSSSSKKLKCTAPHMHAAAAMDPTKARPHIYSCRGNEPDNEY